MIAMIFEVWPKSQHRQDYLDTAECYARWCSL